MSYLLKKHIAAATLLLLGSVCASAASYYVVVPMKAKAAMQPQPVITVSLAASTLPDGLAGSPYRGFNFYPLLTVTGDPSYSGSGVSWSVASGALPAGLVLNPDGTISGTPTAAGQSTFQIKATYQGVDGSLSYQIFVGAITVSLAAATPPEALVGTAYSYDLSQLLTVTGDPSYTSGSVTWTVVSSTLPAGLYLTTDGFIGGTPTAAGTGSVTARATYKGNDGTQTYQVVSLDIKVALAAATLPQAKVGTAYAAYDFKNQLTVTGDAAYDVQNVSFSSSGLPAGLTLSNTGVLSGTPTAKNLSGSAFQVVATYKTKTGQQGYTLIVNGAPLAGVQQIATGNTHTCALISGGAVKCWGYNALGELGDGTLTNQLSPVDVVGLSSGVVSISAGDDHTCVKTSAGGVKCWGYNGEGQVGSGVFKNSATPVDVVGLTSGVSKVVAMHGHSCAITTSGGLKCWGANSSGQLGDNTTTLSLVPVDVTGLTSGVVSVNGGVDHTCAVTSSGGAKCWGANGSGQLGDNTTTDHITPADVYGLTSGVASIGTAYNHTCAVLTTGAAKCWGNNSLGQLGDGTYTTRLAPVSVSGLSSGVASISAGNNHTCALTTNGGVKCWGYNMYGQLGTGNSYMQSYPTDVVGLSGATSLSVAPNDVCATSSAGAQCWGWNNNGQLGDGTTTNRKSPVFVQAP